MQNQRKRQGTNKLPFADVLRLLMEQRGLSVRAIAEMASVSPSVVQSWLSRANPHDLRAVARLAEALDLSFKELLLGDTERKSVRDFVVKDFFEEREMFEGICRITVQRLVPKKRRD